MEPRSKIRADDLETRLGVAQRGERAPIFHELCNLYAEELHADAIKWALARNSPDPLSDGQQALSRAFIVLATNLDRMDFRGRTLLYRFKGAIWSELGHIKSERYQRDNRRKPLDEKTQEPTDDHSRTQERIESAEELKLLWKYAKTPAQRRLLRAGLLKAIGYSWEKAAARVQWPGSPEALRTSFSRLKAMFRNRKSSHTHE